jgi:hypothetical protein
MARIEDGLINDIDIFNTFSSDRRHVDLANLESRCPDDTLTPPRKAQYIVFPTFNP